MPPKDLAQLLLEHDAFIDCAPAEKPLMGYWIGGYCPVDQFPAGARRWRPGQIIQPQDVHFAEFRRDYENLHQLHDQCRDDFFYVASAYWGIPWLEAIMGCDIRAGDTSAWAQPVLAEIDRVSELPVDLDANPWFHCLMDFTQQLLDFAQDRFPVCPPLLRGVGDVAAAMRHTEAFVMDLVDSPDLITALLEMCSQIRREIIDRLAAIIPPWHGAFAAGGYPSKIWSRHSVTYYQEDCAAYLSPQLFSDFLLPYARSAAQAAQVSFIHLHSACLYPVDIILSDGSYDVIEINVDHEGVAPPLGELIGVFQKVQQSGKALLLWGQMTQDDIALLLRELSPNGLSLQPIRMA